jgi:trehalose 6-phosphate synthase
MTRSDDRDVGAEREEADRDSDGDGGSAVRRMLGGRDLVVVSNREPYSHGYDEDGELTVSRPAGGLTAALDPVMQSLGGTWVAWGSGDADFAVTDAAGRVRVPPENPSYTVRRVPLTERQVEEYYLGYSNQVLWPVSHGMPTRATFDDAFWTRYREVNDQFADVVVGEAGDDPVVWFHDYHLALAPRTVRAAGPDAFLLQFWHVPWPSWSAYQRCPHAADLLDGLLANDLVCFHAKRYGRQFLDCVEHCLDADVDRDAAVVHYDGGRTAVRAFPLGIDSEEFETLARSEEAESSWACFADEHDLHDVQVGVGVDRLDYTKGIVERLKALERLWDRNPDRRGTFTFVQKGTESRSEIDEYRRVQREVAAQVERVNARFGTDDWTPIVYRTGYVEQAALAGLYRHADLAIVSPLRDGMNLVAKEYVASQVDGDGVLVLSELAGAAEQLGDDALLVNPNDTEGFADALEAALAMPPAARRRMARLREAVADEDSDAWVAAQFDTAAALEASDDDWDPVPSHAERRERRTPLAWGRGDDVRDRLADADGVLACLDFDGTLAEIVADPEDATILSAARDALRALADAPDTSVAVVSGRALADVRQRVGVDGVAYAGNHGLELFDGERTEVHPDAADAHPTIADLCDDLRCALADVDGVVVEDKRLTATVHYRQVDDARVEDVKATVRDAAANADGVRVTEGKQILELRPDVDWDKGRAVGWLRDQYDDDPAVVYLGDDATDEDAFGALGDRDLAVKVGPSTEPTAADYSVADPGEAAAFLDWLADLLADRTEDEESALAGE